MQRKLMLLSRVMPASIALLDLVRVSWSVSAGIRAPVATHCHCRASLVLIRTTRVNRSVMYALSGATAQIRLWCRWSARLGTTAPLGVRSRTNSHV